MVKLRWAGLLLIATLSPVGGAVGASAEPVAKVQRALPDARLELAGGQVVRLAGVRLPVSEQLAGAATATLGDWVAGRTVRLLPGAVEHDRYGQLVAQVERVDGLWLQGALLERGLALVQTRTGEQARAAAMLARERMARGAGRGLWATGSERPLNAVEAGGFIGQFRIVRGHVKRVARTRGYVYLNFDQDWRTDFTLRVRKPELETVLARWAGDAEQLVGRSIQVRGFLLEAGGPLIELSHPEQIEVMP